MQVLAYFGQRARAALEGCQCAMDLQAGQQPAAGGSSRGTADCSCESLEHMVVLLRDLAYTDAEQLYRVGPGGGGGRGGGPGGGSWVAEGGSGWG